MPNPSEDRINELVKNIIKEAADWFGTHWGEGSFWAYTSGTLWNYGSPTLGMLFYAGGQIQNLIGLATLAKEGIVTSITEFLTYVNQTYYQRYWQLIGSFYSVNDICDLCMVPAVKPDGTRMTTSERMVAYYMKAGLPAAVVQQIQRYENNQITLAQLASYMHLDPTNVMDVQGTGWHIASSLKRDLSDAGVSLSMDSIKLMLEGEADFLASLSEEQFNECVEVIEFVHSNNYTPEQINQLVCEVMVGDPNLIGEYNSIHADATTTTLSGSETHDFIMGNGSANYLYATGGNDILIGSGGDDYLHGGQGSDTYLWRRGDGNDIINDVAVSGDANVLFFSEEVATGDIAFTQNGNHAVFTYTPTGDTITVEDWFSNTANQLSEVKFVDGSIWTAAELNEMLSTATPMRACATNFQLDKAVMDLALADLNLAGGNGDLVCESLGYTPAYDSATISLSASYADDGNVLEQTRKSA